MWYLGRWIKGWTQWSQRSFPTWTIPLSSLGSIFVSCSITLECFDHVNNFKVISLVWVALDARISTAWWGVRSWEPLEGMKMESIWSTCQKSLFGSTEESEQCVCSTGVVSDHLLSTGKGNAVLTSQRVVFPCRGNVWIFLSVTGHFGWSGGRKQWWLFVRDGGEKYL